MRLLTDPMTFTSLVNEAFIQPLRSVLIVDDEYPTWEQILHDHCENNSKTDAPISHAEEKSWKANPDGPMNLIKQFRRLKPGLIIDIHDGGDIDNVDYLHQSDLLVLDYNLEGDKTGLRGALARSVLQSVLVNKHFNLVVVHTGEESLEDVMFECLLATFTSCTEQFGDNVDNDLISLDEKLDALEIDEKFDRTHLFKLFGVAEYLELRHPSTKIEAEMRLFMRCNGALGALGAWGVELNLKGKDLKSFFYWAIREFEKQHFDLFASDTLEGLSWNTRGGCIWMRATRGFVTFVSKGPDDVVEALLRALEDWKPTPSRLISAKHRHVLSSIGVEAEDRTLQKSHVFAHFYKDYCSNSIPNLTDEEKERLRVAKLKAYVARQSEAISFCVEDEVAGFGEKIRLIDEESNGEFSSHYGLDLTEDDSPEVRKAIAHYNSYVSTLPLKNGEDQLDSGHIFKWANEWWVCATPACDLQPGQNTTAFVGSSSEQRPFTALKLLPIRDDELKKDHINSGLFCFVEQQPGDVICLGLERIEKSTSVANGKASWRTFVASQNGLIENNLMQIIVPSFKSDKLELVEGIAEIVAKLRYEYALNYIQRVGTSVTRIGLGYASSS